LGVPWKAPARSGGRYFTTLSWGVRMKKFGEDWGTTDLSLFFCILTLFHSEWALGVFWSVAFHTYIYIYISVVIWSGIIPLGLPFGVALENQPQEDLHFKATLIQVSNPMPLMVPNNCKSPTQPWFLGVITMKFASTLFSAKCTWELHGHVGVMCPLGWTFPAPSPRSVGGMFAHPFSMWGAFSGWSWYHFEGLDLWKALVRKKNRTGATGYVGIRI
jgi:hypothetical protein